MGRQGTGATARGLNEADLGVTRAIQCGFNGHQDEEMMQEEKEANGHPSEKPKKRNTATGSSGL